MADFKATEEQEAIREDESRIEFVYQKRTVECYIITETELVLISFWSRMALTIVGLPFAVWAIRGLLKRIVEESRGLQTD